MKSTLCTLLGLTLLGSSSFLHGSLRFVNANAGSALNTAQLTSAGTHAIGNHTIVDAMMSSPFPVNGLTGSGRTFFAGNSYDYGDTLSNPATYSETGIDGQPGGFFNQFTNGQTDKRIRMTITHNGNANALSWRTNSAGSHANANDLLVFNDNSISELTYHYEYLGDPNFYSPGITGRWEGGIPSGAIQSRPLIGLYMNNDVYNAELTALSTQNWHNGGTLGATNFTAADFEFGRTDPFFAGGSINLIAPTLSGTTATWTDLNDGQTEGIWFDLDSRVEHALRSFSITVTPGQGDATFNAGTEFAFSLDGKAVVIPEPSRALLFAAGFALLTLRRKRA